MKIRILLPILILSSLLLTGGPALAARHQTAVTGKTMGTFYSVKLITAKKEFPETWQNRIDNRLKQVNKNLSMFDPDSEISRFNRQPAGTPFEISPDFSTVLSVSQQIFQLSRGAWDGTVKPLVDLWGFGTRSGKFAVPEPDKIASALSRVGFDKLELTPKTLTATSGQVTLDLGSIAKGFGVDAVAGLLRSYDIKDYLVEIGGEVSGAGHNQKRKPWSVGIIRPEKNQMNQGIYRVVTLKDQAIATSGDYRNYVVKNHQTYSHIIDPKTGYPVKNQVVSTSVIAPDCTLADGLATALMVMDIKDGIAMINSLDQVECLIIQKTDTGFEEFESAGFAKLVQH